MCDRLCDGVRQTVLDLIDDLKTNVMTEAQEKKDLTIVEAFFSTLRSKKLMENIVKHMLPHATEIRNRNTNFFLNNRSLFSGLPSNKVDYYSEYLASDSKIDDESRDVIWDFLDVIVKYAEKYKKNI